LLKWKFGQKNYKESIQKFDYSNIPCKDGIFQDQNFWFTY
jgi:hypothetical protein